MSRLQNRDVGSTPSTESNFSASPDTGHTVKLALMSTMFSCFLILIMVVFLIWHYHRKARELSALYTRYNNQISHSESSNPPPTSPGPSQAPAEARAQTPQIMFGQMQAAPASPSSPDVQKQAAVSIRMEGDLTNSNSATSPFSSPFPVCQFVTPTPFLDTQGGRYAPPIDFLQPLENASLMTSEGLGSPISETQSDVAGAGTSSRCLTLDYNIQLMDLKLRDLGVGASGWVKEAIYVTSDGEVHHVAAKYALNSSSIFRDELEIIAKLAPHDNIVKYYGGRFSGPVSRSASDGMDCFLVMELMFTNLEDIIHGDLCAGRMSYRLILTISLDIIKGLGHLHANGIIHYDLKPSNVLLNEDFVAKLADFGSSKRRFRSETTASLRGTMGYIAPEVLLGHFFRPLKVSEKLDIFSAGVVMWEMVTGEHPPNPDHSRSRSSSFQDSLTWSRDHIPRVLSSSAFQNASTERCPLTLRTLIEDCLNIEPELRPTTEEIKERLLDMQSLIDDDV